MKKTTAAFCTFAIMLLLACNPQSPDSNFNKIVLNTNIFHDFANPNVRTRIVRGIGVKTVDNKVQYDDQKNPILDTIPAEFIVDNQLAYLKDAYQNVKDIKPDDEISEMRNTALKMYEMAIPVYENEYRQYAKMLDTHQPKEQSDSLLKAINDKYSYNFGELALKLRAIAQPYAEKHKLNVKWGN